jgi:hypothetical protein
MMKEERNEMTFFHPLCDFIHHGPNFFPLEETWPDCFLYTKQLDWGSRAKLQKEVIPKTTIFLQFFSSYEHESIRRICFPKATLTP